MKKNDRIYDVKGFDLSQENMGLQETIFHNANGYLGVRGNLEEGLPEGMDTMRGTYINGFYDMVPMKQAELLCNLVEDKEALLNVADAQTLKCRLGDTTFSMWEGECENLCRTLDMNRGITTRTLRWHMPEGKSVDFDIRRMASFSEKSLFMIDYRVTSVDYSGRAQILSLHEGIVHNYSNPNDPRMAAESGDYLKKVAGKTIGDVSLLVSETASTHLRVASAVALEITRNGKPVYPGDGCLVYDEETHQTIFRMETSLTPGDTLRVVKYCIFTDSRRSPEPAQDALARLAAVREKGTEVLYQEQQEFLEEFWNRTGLSVEGDEELNQSLQYNMYALLQSAGTDGITSIPAKGLSGEGYEGHYFWDTEMFMLPFFAMNAPEIARKLLSYRYHTLPQARHNAMLLGHKKGALYPWRTITGRECSGYFPSGTAAYHINGDIAYAVVLYYLSTGDVEFMREEGFEILLESARLWMDVGNFYQDEFQINCVTGPDEYTCMVNNNYYTNCCARYNLEWVCRLGDAWQKDTEFWKQLCQRLDIAPEELPEMKRAAEKMRLVYDENLGINPQDDSFLQKPVWDLSRTDPKDFPLLLHYPPLHLYRYQVCKQADTVLAHYLFPAYQSEETIRKSFDYYEKITTHDSSLSTCVFSIVASRLGLHDKAVYYMGDSAKMDLKNTHHNSRDGIHAANMGGSYMAIVNGLGGLRMEESRVSLAPFLPESWEGFSFRFTYRGSVLEAAVKKTPDGSCRTELAMVSGHPVCVCLYGIEKVLAEGESITDTPD